MSIPRVSKICIHAITRCAKYLRIRANFQIMNAKTDIWLEFHVFVTIYAVFLVPHTFDDIFTACFCATFSIKPTWLPRELTFRKSVYTMSPCIYHDSMSLPWVHVHTMGSFLYYESISIRWVNVYTLIPCPYHESMSIPWVIVNNKSHCTYYEARHFNYRNTKKTSTQIKEEEKN